MQIETYREKGRLNFIKIALSLLGEEKPTFEILRQKIEEVYILVASEKITTQSRIDCSQLQNLMMFYFDFTILEIDELNQPCK